MHTHTYQYTYTHTGSACSRRGGHHDVIFVYIYIIIIHTHTYQYTSTRTGSAGSRRGGHYDFRCLCYRHPTCVRSRAFSSVCILWLFCVCDMSHLHVWYDAFIRVTLLIHMCDVKHSYVYWALTHMNTYETHMNSYVYMCSYVWVPSTHMHASRHTYTQSY